MGQLLTAALHQHKRRAGKVVSLLQKVYKKGGKVSGQSLKDMFKFIQYRHSSGSAIYL